MRIILGILAGALCFVSLPAAEIASGRPDDARWARVRQARQDHDPRAALELVSHILADADPAADPVGWLRALAARLSLAREIDPVSEPELLRQLEAGIAPAPATVRPAAQALLAGCYRECLDRHPGAAEEPVPPAGALAGETGAGSRSELVRRIDALYQAALADPVALARLPSEPLAEAFPIPAEAVDEAPGILDRIAAGALAFYERISPPPEADALIGPDSPFLGTWETFVAAVKARPADDPSPHGKALRIHAALLGIHALDGDRRAFVAAELGRFRCLAGRAVPGPAVPRLIAGRLEDLMAAFPDVPLLAEACADLSAAWQGAGEFGPALAAVQLGATAFPETRGGRRCRERARRLAARELALELDPVAAPGEACLRVRYRNVERLYYRVYSDRWVNQPEYHDPGISLGGRRALERLLARRPLAAGSMELPGAAAFVPLRTGKDLPRLRPGFYRVLVSPEADWGRTAHIQQGWFWISRLTAVSWARGNGVEGYALDNCTGEPLGGVAVQAVRVEGRDQVRMLGGAETDRQGHFEIDRLRSGQSVHLLLRRGDEEVTLAAALSPAPGPSSAERREQTVFFTDRSIYRPGQVVRFKGVCLRVNPRGGTAEVLAGRAVRVALVGGRGEELASLDAVTNRQGSVAGELALPAGRVPGGLRLMCAAPAGQADIRVEPPGALPGMPAAGALASPVSAEIRVPGLAREGTETAATVRLPGDGELRVIRLRPPMVPGGPDAGDAPEWSRWPEGEEVVRLPVRAGEGAAAVTLRLPAGAYRLEARSVGAGDRDAAAAGLLVWPPAGTKSFPLPIPLAAAVSAAEARVGDVLDIAWGTGDDRGRALVDVLRGGRSVRRFWTEPGLTAQEFRLPVDPGWQGGFVVRIRMMRGRRLLVRDFPVRVPWDDRYLRLAEDASAESSAAGPGTLRLRVSGLRTGAGSAMGPAEAAAVLTDVALEPVAAAWRPFAVFPDYRDAPGEVFPDHPGGSVVCRDDGWLGRPSPGPFPGWADYLRDLQRRGVWRRPLDPARLAAEEAAPAAAADRAAVEPVGLADIPLAEGDLPPGPPQRPPAESAAGPAPVFPPADAVIFLPQLTVGSDGVVEIPLPAAGTAGAWKLRVLVHTADGRSGVATLDVKLPPAVY